MSEILKGRDNTHENVERKDNSGQKYSRTQLSHSCQYNRSGWLHQQISPPASVKEDWKSYQLDKPTVLTGLKSSSTLCWNTDCSGDYLSSERNPLLDSTWLKCQRPGATLKGNTLFKTQSGWLRKGNAHNYRSQNPTCKSSRVNDSVRRQLW